jgi:SAM-dependent methyltransferase
MKQILNEVNLSTYQAQYKTMEHDHAYPNINLVRLEKWFIKEPGYVLDHGCGYGENLIFLTSRGYKVLGVDISKDLIDFVKMKCKIRHVPQTLFDLQVLDGEDHLPYHDNMFNHIISLGVLEMLSNRESAMFCLSELSRCLQKGGKMIVSTLAPENSFVFEGKSMGDEQYQFKGKEAHKDISLEYNLYVPNSKESFKSIFPSECTVEEIGSWDNDYCNVKGKHYVALITKNK